MWSATEEIKFDGFRALAYIEEGKCRLISSRRHEYQSFRELCASIADHLNGHDAVLDGELVCVDPFGRSQFYDLMFRRRDPFFSSLRSRLAERGGYAGTAASGSEEETAKTHRPAPRLARAVPRSSRRERIGIV